MRELTLDKLPKNILAKLDLETVFKASRCVIAAERLQIFRRLYVRELSAADIADTRGFMVYTVSLFSITLSFLAC
jgi:hypothetical protein